MARYVIRQKRIWDTLKKQWVVNGYHRNFTVVQKMCKVLNDDYHGKYK